MSSRSLDGVLIKPGNRQESYTEHQIQELVKCMDPDDGYMYFAKNYAYIQHPTKGKVKFEPYPFQIGLLEAYHNHRYSCNLLSRQTGKCLEKDTTVNLKNKNTGEVIQMTVEEFFNLQKGS